MKKIFGACSRWSWPICLFAACVACCSGAKAQSSGTVHIVRVGVGDLEGLKKSISRSVEACRIVKNLPAGDVALPSNDYLSKLAIVEEEEFFDGALWATYNVQRQIAGDALNGCKLTLFTHRDATVERACQSRVRGNTALMGELLDLESPSTAGPSVEEDLLTETTCRDKPKIVDLQGLPRFDAGAARCVWSSDIVAAMMAKLGMKGGGASGDQGFDTCLYEAIPYYMYRGERRPVILTTRSGKLTVLEQEMGEVRAAGNLMLKEFNTGQPIPPATFTRARVEAYLKQPSRSSVEAH